MIHDHIPMLIPMHVQARCRTSAALMLSIGVALAGCSSLDGAAHRVANVVTPYKVEVVQGNFVSREQVEALQPGMSRQQVRDILGTPRSEEHTSELQSQSNLVCRLLLEKKKKT